MCKQRLTYTTLIAITLLLILVQCNQGTGNKDLVVAEVGIRKLHLSEVSAVIPKELSTEDSTVVADDYIRKWIRQELMLRKAEENLSAEVKNVEKELAEYRNSLLIFKYKNELMAQRMDTTITDSQILGHYTANPENFILDHSIVKAIYVKIPAEAADPLRLKAMTEDTSTEGISQLRDYCVQYAINYDIITNRWIRFDQILKNIPLSIEDPEQYLQQNQFIEHTDSTSFYLVAIHDYKLKNNQAPVEYVRGHIKSLILNRRKIEFLRDLENNVYREGVNNNRFKIHNIEKDETN
jgi:hypothetical protein